MEKEFRSADEMIRHYGSVKRRLYGAPKVVMLTKPAIEPEAPSEPQDSRAERLQRQIDTIRKAKKEREDLQFRISVLEEELELSLNKDSLTDTKRQIDDLKIQLAATSKSSTSLKRILRLVSRATGYSEEEICSRERSFKLVLVRHACMYWMARRNGATAPVIGKFLGGKDHTTVLHGWSNYVYRRGRIGRNLPEIKRGRSE